MMSKEDILSLIKGYENQIEQVKISYSDPESLVFHLESHIDLLKLVIGEE